jgi:hypothetical protein
MSEHNLVELLSQLEAATLAEETVPVPLAPSTVAVVLVGTVAPAADGLPRLTFGHPLCHPPLGHPYATKGHPLCLPRLLILTFGHPLCHPLCPTPRKLGRSAA